MNIVEIIRILWSIVNDKILANRLFPSLTFKVIIESENESQSCPTFCDPMDCTVHAILQARILEWVAYPFSRGSFQPRN